MHETEERGHNDDHSRAVQCRNLKAAGLASASGQHRKHISTREDSVDDRQLQTAEFLMSKILAEQLEKVRDPGETGRVLGGILTAFWWHCPTPRERGVSLDARDESLDAKLQLLTWKDQAAVARLQDCWCSRGGI